MEQKISNNNILISPEKKFFKKPEALQFNDGDGALGFRTIGDNLILGPEGNFNEARNFHANIDDDGNMAIIKTKSGNKYKIAQGLLINENEGLYYELPKDSINITIGKPLNIIGMTSTEVTNVMLHDYKVGSHGEDTQYLDVPSPFKALAKQVKSIYRTKGY